MMWIRTWLLAAILLVPLGALAQVSDTFLINASFIGSDTEAPTTPQNLVATAVSFDQIDLTWDASTDNVIIDGYQVFRDSVQIATTTATTYSDGGLTASTSYAYTVVAFDGSTNFSSSSATATAVTLALPATTTATTTAGRGSESTRTSTSVTIENLMVTPSQTGFLITFTTDAPARTTLRWGQGSGDEGGYSLQDTLQTNHRVRIDGLEPGTLYTLQLQLTDRFNRLAATLERSVATLAAPDITAPPNVMDFRALPTDSGVALSWVNPEAEDFARVRIVRSERFYPTDLADGLVVYEGSGERYLDTRLRPDVAVYYYTAFAVDAAGNRSSGAITFAILRPATTGDTPGVPSEPAPRVTELPVRFSQGDRSQVITDTAQLQLTGEGPTTLSIPYEALPENLKTIIVTITEQESKAVFSFLLRVNRDKTAFEATIGSLPGGIYDVEVTLFDYALGHLARSTSTLFVSALPAVPAGEHPLAHLRFWVLLLAPLGLLLLLSRRLTRHVA